MYLNIENRIKEYKKNQFNNLVNGSYINGSPIISSKKFKRKNKIRINYHTSEESTINTISNSPTEINCLNQNLSKIDNNLHQDPSEIICRKMNKAFEALEQLIIDDYDKEKNNEEDIIDNSSSSNKASNNNDVKSNKKCKLKKEKKSRYKSQSISIPKLDFSDIFDYYSNTPVNIKVIDIKKSKHNDEIEKCKFYSNYLKKHHHKIKNN